MVPQRLATARIWSPQPAEQFQPR